MRQLISCGISYRFPIVIPRYQAGYPTRYSPVLNSSKKSKLSSAFYLHVVGTASVRLSQDQLSLKVWFTLITVSLWIILVFLTGYISLCHPTQFVLFQFSKGFVFRDNYIGMSPIPPPCQLPFLIFLFLFNKNLMLEPVLVKQDWVIRVLFIINRIVLKIF